MQKNTLAAGLLALTLTTLTSCGGAAEDSSSDGSGESAELEVLTDEQAEQALLSETVMGETFTASEPAEDSDDDAAPGCLAALDDLDDIGAETEAKIQFTSTSDIGLPELEHDIFSYEDTDPISARIQEVVTALDGCTSVEETGEDGTEYALDVSLSTDTTTDNADEQITLQAVGTIFSAGQELPLGVYMSSVRVENHVSVVVFTDIPEDPEASAASFEDYVNAGADRLAAVAAGEEPSEEPIVAPAT